MARSRRKRSPSTRRASRASRTGNAAIAGALRVGRANARTLLLRRAVVRRQHDLRRAGLLRRGNRRADMGGALLIAEGDSWFDYPFDDVLGELEDRFNYDVHSAAHMGDTIEQMAYDPDQYSKFVRMLEKLDRAGKKPRAILLSGGGNDVAGDELATLLNHHGSNLPALNEDVMSGMIDHRLRLAMVTAIGTITHLVDSRFGVNCPLLIHGYDYPVPDGRGYAGGFWFLPGPWLEPSFRKKGYEDLTETTQLMRTVIDRFNAMAASIAGTRGLEHVHYVDLRGTLSNQLAGKAYKKSWANELHPTRPGYEAIAGQFHNALLNV